MAPWRHCSAGCMRNCAAWETRTRAGVGRARVRPCDISYWRPCLTHPEFETLIEFAAGELRGDGLLAVRAHVERCADCRLEAELVLASVGKPPHEAEPALSSVLEKARQGKAERAAAGSGDQREKSRAAGAIAAYLGARA